MAATSNTNSAGQSPDYLKVATDIVTLAGAIISTWYLADIVTHGQLTSRWHTEVGNARRAWKEAQWRRRFRDTPPWVVVWEAEETLKEASSHE
jgi:hypothetical protein